MVDSIKLYRVYINLFYYLIRILYSNNRIWCKNYLKKLLYLLLINTLKLLRICFLLKLMLGTLLLLMEKLKNLINYRNTLIIYILIKSINSRLFFRLCLQLYILLIIILLVRLDHFLKIYLNYLKECLISKK